MSAVANTENQGQSVGLVDTDQLVVRRLVVDEGPSAKRIQPAPMGRAFRIIKRTCHVTIEIGTREGKRE
jgi:large subunit ribosomal protein L22